MQHVRRALPAALIAAALATGIAACGTAAKPAASPDPLAKLTADQIANQAINDLNETTSVRFAGTMTDSGQVITMALTLVRGKGCQGSMGLQGKGTFQMVYNGASIWMLPSDSFYKSMGGTSSVISLLSGKWLKLGKTSDLSDFSSFCSLSSLVSQMKGNPTKATKGTDTTVDGQRAVTLHQTTGGQFGTAYVSDAAKPELLKIPAPQGSTTGSITFSDYGVPVTITPPPASKTLDGSQFGF
jgi:hypothetical protein